MTNGKISDVQFEKFSKLIKSELGIHINDAKKEIVRSKLVKLVRDAGLECYDDYYNLILNFKNSHWVKFVDEITIHKTNFFREENHFEYIRNHIQNILKNNPRINDNLEIRVWSSACSTGDEAYTLGMVFKECLPVGIDIKILATDISPKVIKEAMVGEYVLDSEDLVSSYYLGKYFVRKDNGYKVVKEIKDMVTFRTFNLMDSFPFQKNFDIIFCRNVMIYFDNNTQDELINKFFKVLSPGGLLFIGHSESLNHKQHNFKYIQPTVYMKAL